jgi:hypothetical protein
MIDPSGLRLPDETEFRIEKIENGLYSVVNAYDGEYEYFDERPIKKQIGFAPSGLLESEPDVSPISGKI